MVHYNGMRVFDESLKTSIMIYIDIAVSLSIMQSLNNKNTKTKQNIENFVDIKIC